MTDIPRLCAAMSLLSYGAPTMGDVAPLGMTWVMNYSRGASQATMAGDGRRVFVAFTGTNDIRDVLYDLRYVKTDFPGGGRVHEGFYRAFEPIWEVVERDLLSLDPPLPRYYTGHSLGAAMAQLAAATEGFLPDQLRVFGCPKVGNADFVDRITCPTWRYEARLDPVPWMPWSWGPVQAGYALINGRAPSIYRQPGVTVPVKSWFHSMEAYRGATED